LTAFCSYNGIFVKFLLEEGSNARDDCRFISWESIDRKGNLPRTDILYQLMKRGIKNYEIEKKDPAIDVLESHLSSTNLSVVARNDDSEVRSCFLSRRALVDQATKK